MDIALGIAFLALATLLTALCHLRYRRTRRRPLRPRADGEPLGRRIEEATAAIMRRQW